MTRGPQRGFRYCSWLHTTKNTRNGVRNALRALHLINPPLKSLSSWEQAGTAAPKGPKGKSIRFPGVWGFPPHGVWGFPNFSLREGDYIPLPRRMKKESHSKPYKCWILGLTSCNLKSQFLQLRVSICDTILRVRLSAGETVNLKRKLILILDISFKIN